MADAEKITTFAEMTCFVDRLFICRELGNVNQAYPNEDGTTFFTDGYIRVYDSVDYRPATISVSDATVVLIEQVKNVTNGPKVEFTLWTIRDITESAWKIIVEKIRAFKKLYNIDT